MTNPKDNVGDELAGSWNREPVGKCYCGCGRETDGHFVAGHDAYFAARLLGQLRDNEQVANAIQSLIDDATECPGYESSSWTQVLVDVWGWVPGSPCPCGCGRKPARDGSVFRPGHDARLYSRLLANLLAVSKDNPRADRVVHTVLTWPDAA